LMVLTRGKEMVTQTAVQRAAVLGPSLAAMSVDSKEKEMAGRWVDPTDMMLG